MYHRRKACNIKTYSIILDDEMFSRSQLQFTSFRKYVFTRALCVRQHAIAYHEHVGVKDGEHSSTRKFVAEAEQRVDDLDCCADLQAIEVTVSSDDSFFLGSIQEEAHNEHVQITLNGDLETLTNDR